MDKMLDAGFRTLNLKKKLFLFYQAPSIQYLLIKWQLCSPLFSFGSCLVFVQT